MLPFGQPPPLRRNTPSALGGGHAAASLNAPSQNATLPVLSPDSTLHFTPSVVTWTTFLSPAAANWPPPNATERMWSMQLPTESSGPFVQVAPPSLDHIVTPHPPAA